MDDLGDLKKRLTPEQYRVTQEGSTDPPFSHALYKNKEDGMYHCICCGVALFSSESKFDSGSGWPSFWSSQTDAVQTREDESHGMIRTEAVCQCGAHLGHIFDDGPDPTGQRFCINGSSLDFRKST